MVTEMVRKLTRSHGGLAGDDTPTKEGQTRCASATPSFSRGRRTQMDRVRATDADPVRRPRERRLSSFARVRRPEPPRDDSCSPPRPLRACGRVTVSASELRGRTTFGTGRCGGAPRASVPPNVVVFGPPGRGEIRPPPRARRNFADANRHFSTFRRPFADASRHFSDTSPTLCRH